MRLLNQLRQMTLFQFRMMMRNKIAFFFNLVMPLLFLMVFGFMYTDQDAGATPIGLADRDGGPAALVIRQALDSAGIYQVTSGDEERLLEELDRGKLWAVVVLGEGLSEQMTRRQGPAAVVVRWDPTSSASGTALGGLRYLLRSLDAEGRPMQPAFEVREEAIEAVAHLNVMDFMMPGMLTYMLLNAGVVSVAITVAYLRKNGTMRHLFSTPVSLGVWMAGRILSNLVLAVIQVLLVWLVGMALFKVQPPSNATGTAVVLFLAALAGMGIGLAIGVLAKDGDAAQPMALIVSMALTFLGNAMFPLDQAPQIVQFLMRLMPSYYMTHSLQLVMMKGQALVSVPFDLAIMAATAAAGIALAMWRLRQTFVLAA